jgi:hypothetical protein
MRPTDRSPTVWCDTTTESRLLPMDRAHLLAVVLSAGLGQAQYNGTFSNPSSSYGTFPSLGKGSSEPVLADSRRLQVSQSVTIASSCGRGGSSTSSLYENQLAYKLSDPWTLRLGLGILAPLQSSGWQAQAQGSRGGPYLIPDVGLEYRPTESLFFAMRYCSIPGGLGMSSDGPFGPLSWR